MTGTNHVNTVCEELLREIDGLVPDQPRNATGFLLGEDGRSDGIHGIEGA